MGDGIAKCLDLRPEACEELVAVRVIRGSTACREVRPDAHQLRKANLVVEYEFAGKPQLLVGFRFPAPSLRPALRSAEVLGWQLPNEFEDVAIHLHIQFAFSSTCGTLDRASQLSLDDQRKREAELMCRWLIEVVHGHDRIDAASAKHEETRALGAETVEELEHGARGRDDVIRMDSLEFDPLPIGEGARYVHVSMRDNAEHLPADYVAAMEATRTTRPFWFRSFVLGEWGAFEGAAFTEFDPAVHVVEPFEIPSGWERFESMDHGANNPTAWLLWAVDYDGNLVVADEYYSPGLVSMHAQEILRRRKQWETNGQGNTCWADPSVFARHGLETRLGDPASIATEYADFRIGLSPANNDRKAGYLRLCELLHVEPGRTTPPWTPIPDSASGAPRLYVFSSCKHLIEQLKSAPVAADGVDAGEAIEPKWASAHGHAVDAARYGALSRPSPSEEPPPPLLDERAEALRQTYVRERELSEELELEQCEDSLYGGWP